MSEKIISRRREIKQKKVFQRLTSDKRLISSRSMGREVGGGFRIGNMCTSVADSC